MPRETIGNADEFHVQVGWSADQDVQIGVVTPGERSVFWQLLAPDEGSGERRVSKLAKLGEVVRGVVSDCMEEDKLRAHEAALAGEVIEDPGGTLRDARVGERLLNALDGTAWPNASLWMDLDRRRCNRLIRLVRKARDAAYGRDE